MGYIKKNKVKISVIAAFVIIMLLAVVGIIKILYPDSSKSLYGNRLDGMENVKIEQDRFSRLNQTLKTDEVNSVKSYLTGKIVKIFIEVKKDTSILTCENLADKALTLFDDDEKKYYDIEVFATSENKEDENYPRIGYKNRSSLKFKWSNN